MTALQRALRDAIYAGPRGVRKKLTGPFQIWLNAPELGHIAQALGAHVRYKTSLSPRLSETAICATAQFWKAHYEWHAHAPIAEKAGVKPQTIKEIQAGREPKSAAKDERAIIDFVRELYKTRRVSDKTYKRVHGFLGDQGMVELVGICGYYALISMTLNVFRAQIPADAPLPFAGAGVSRGMTLWNSPYTPDLRGFIAYLEAEHPEQIVRITKEVDPKFGVSGILERLERDEKFPLVIFENVKGSKIPLVANMHASFERLRLGLGMERGDVKAFVKECAARQAHPIDPVKVETGPVQEVVRLGKEVDVEELPICTYHEKDAGKYITAGLAVMRDPETGINNVGIYRHMVHEKNLLGVQLSETADGNIIWKKYEKRGLPCPVAIVIGHHPAFFIGALCFSTLDSDEIRIAGGMLQRPVPLVRCKTIPLDVPADAEIVLECEIRRANGAPKRRSANIPAHMARAG